MRKMRIKRKNNNLHLPNKRFKHLRILKVVILLLKIVLLENILYLQETEGKSDKKEKENEEVDLDLDLDINE